MITVKPCRSPARKRFTWPLAARLAEGWLERHAGGAPWTAQQVGAHLRTAGVAVDEQVWATGVRGKATNAVGVTRESLLRAVEARA